MKGELLDPLSPQKVRAWMERRPDWLEVHAVKQGGRLFPLELGAGERDAIQLALDSGINHVLIDEKKGRGVAEELSLQVEGTLGALERTSALGATDFREALRKLEGTNFRLSPALRAAFLSRII